MARSLKGLAGWKGWGTDGGDWAPALFWICPPRAGRRYSCTDGRDYLSFVEALAATGKGGAVGEDQRLSIREEFVILGGLVGGEAVWWKDLPRAIVVGSVGLVNCPGLERIDLTVLGDLNISNCPKLRQVRGEVFGSAHISESGLEDVGADFRVAGQLSLVACRNLRRLNCDIGGDFRADKSGDFLVGPAFNSKNRREVTKTSQDSPD